MAAVLIFSADLGRRDLDFFGDLHARMSPPLKRFFRSYRLNAADVDDLTQDVFMRLSGPGAQTNLRKPEAFVFTLARNLVRDRARRLHTRAATQSINVDDVDLTSERPTPDQSLEITQQLAHVEQTLASLKPRTCEAFMLHRVHGESYADIAAQMNISVSMVEKHIMSAMHALRTLNSD